MDNLSFLSLLAPLSLSNLHSLLNNKFYNNVELRYKERRWKKKITASLTKIYLNISIYSLEIYIFYILI